MIVARKLPNTYTPVVLTVCALLQLATCLMAIHLSSPADWWFIWIFIFGEVFAIASAITHWVLYVRRYIDFRIDNAMQETAVALNAEQVRQCGPQ